MLSRRSFLRLGAQALLGTSFGLRAELRKWWGGPPPDEWEFVQPRPTELGLLGRMAWTTPVYPAADFTTDIVDWLPFEDVVPLFEEVRAPGPNPRNDLWWRTEHGYVYSASVQAMRPYRMPEIITEMPSEFGFWAEVIVPYTLARVRPRGELIPQECEPFYHYATVYHVTGIDQDVEGEVWYQVFDDMPPRLHWWVLARHLRPIASDEFPPISLGVPDKHITVSLAEQRIDCYEGDQLVYSTLCASGVDEFATPEGEHYVVLKQPSRHMYDISFSLPGVPWNTFFTTQGHAIHGAYWHSDFGRPRSHGCLNVSPEAAQWIYRWVDPVAPYDGDFVPGTRRTGTPVIVV